MRSCWCLRVSTSEGLKRLCNCWATVAVAAETESRSSFVINDSFSPRLLLSSLSFSMFLRLLAFLTEELGVSAFLHVSHYQGLCQKLGFADFLHVSLLRGLSQELGFVAFVCWTPMEQIQLPPDVNAFRGPQWTRTHQCTMKDEW